MNLQHPEIAAVVEPVNLQRIGAMGEPVNLQHPGTGAMVEPVNLQYAGIAGVLMS